MASGTIYAQAGWTGYAASGKVTQRAYLVYSTSETPTAYYVTVNSGIQQYNGTWTNLGVTCSLSYYGSSSRTITHKGAYTHHQFYGGALISYSKSKARQNEVTITAVSTITSGVDAEHGKDAVLNQPSYASYIFSIPPIDNYAVAYNANGGENAPESQTKWYTENLVLQTSIPTRSGYRFVGWNTEADGSGTSYAPGAVYSTNAGVTLYAQWVRNALIAFAKVVDAIKRCTVYGKVNGTIVTPVSGYVKVNGVWKQIRDDL